MTSNPRQHNLQKHIRCVCVISYFIIRPTLSMNSVFTRRISLHRPDRFHLPIEGGHEHTVHCMYRIFMEAIRDTLISLAVSYVKEQTRKVNHNIVICPKNRKSCFAHRILHFVWVIAVFRPSQWPRVLRHEPSSPARTMGSWVRIPLMAWMSVCGWSPVQRVLPTVHRIKKLKKRPKCKKGLSNHRYIDR
jgi:hypothetical protein